MKYDPRGGFYVARQAAQTKRRHPRCLSSIRRATYSCVRIGSSPRRTTGQRHRLSGRAASRLRSVCATPAADRTIVRDHWSPSGPDPRARIESSHPRRRTTRGTRPVSKAWQAYAAHILDAIAKIERIQQRGDLTRDDVLRRDPAQSADTVGSNATAARRSQDGMARYPVASDQWIPQYSRAQLFGRHRRAYSAGRRTQAPAATQGSGQRHARARRHAQVIVSTLQHHIKEFGTCPQPRKPSTNPATS